VASRDVFQVWYSLPAKSNALAGIAAINNALGGFDTSYQWFNGRKREGEDDTEQWRRLNTQVYLMSGGTQRLW
jgi:hypothetical protein